MKDREGEHDGWRWWVVEDMVAIDNKLLVQRQAKEAIPAADRVDYQQVRVPLAVIEQVVN